VQRAQYKRDRKRGAGGAAQSIKARLAKKLWEGPANKKGRRDREEGSCHDLGHAGIIAGVLRAEKEAPMKKENEIT